MRLFSLHLSVQVMRSRVEFVFAYGAVSAQSYFGGEFWDVVPIQVRLVSVRVLAIFAHLVCTGSWTALRMISATTVCLCLILSALHFGRGIAYMKHIKISARIRRGARAPRRPAAGRAGRGETGRREAARITDPARGGQRIRKDGGEAQSPIAGD